MLLAESSADPLQNELSDDERLEVITVRAQKRPQALQDVPLALTVINAESLAPSQLKDLLDLSDQVPSLNIIQQGTVSATNLYIRGLGSSASDAGLESSVGVFIDEVYQSRAANVMSDLVDIEQIEVIRGPQSSLFGKNTSAGVISIATKRPLDTASYFSQLTLGNYGSRQLTAVATGPLSDPLSYRISASRHRSEGFFLNKDDGSEINNRDRWGVRGQLLFEADEKLSLLFTANYDEVDELCCAASFFRHQATNAVVLQLLGGSEIGTDPYSRQVSQSNEPYYQHEQMRLSLKADWTGEISKLTAITAYQGFESKTGGDADFTTLALTSPHTRQVEEQRVFSQELRWSSIGEGTLQWIAGAYYLNQRFDLRHHYFYGEDMRPYVDVFTSLLAGAVPLVGLSPLAVFEQFVLAYPPNSFFAEGQGLQSGKYELGTESLAVFGRADWQASDKFTLGVGLRWTQEEKHIDARYQIDDDFSALDLSPGGPILAINPMFSSLSALQFFPPVEDQQHARTKSHLSGSVDLASRINEHFNVYSSLRRGFKSGGFQVTSFIPRSGLEFDDERVSSLEVGLKLNNPNNTWQANLSAFSQRVEGYQLYVIENNSTAVKNASDVDIRGVELDWVQQLNRQFTFTLSATYLDTEFIKFDNAPCPFGSITLYCDLSGQALPSVPRWASSATATYRHTIKSVELQAWLQYAYKGKRFVSLDRDPVSEQGSVGLVNASVALAIPGSAWELSFWGRNLSDEHYTESMFDSVVLPGDQNAFPAAPRTFGLSLTLRQ